MHVPSLASSRSIVASFREEDQAFLPLDCLFFRAISDWKTMRFLGFRLEILLRRPADFARFCFFKLGPRPVHCMASTVDGLDTGLWLRRHLLTLVLVDGRNMSVSLFLVLVNVVVHMHLLLLVWLGCVC